MALTRHQLTANSNVVASTSLVITPLVNSSAPHSLMVLVVAYDNAGASGADPFVSIVDGVGNTWTSRQAILNNPGTSSSGTVLRIFTTSQDVAQWFSSSGNITISFGAVSVTAKAWLLLDFTGSVNDPVYVTGAGSTASTASPTITSGSIAINDLILGAVAIEAGTTQTATADADTTNGSWTALDWLKVGTTTTGMVVLEQDKIVTAAGAQTFNPTFGISGDLSIAWIQIHEPPAPLSATITEAATAATTQTAAAVEAAAQAEAAAATEAVTGVLPTSAQAEAAAATEAEAAAAIEAADRTEAAAAAEAEAAIQISAADVAEAAVATDVLSATRASSGAVSEALAAVDAASAVLVAAASLIEAIAAGDSQTANATLAALRTEAAAAADATAASAAFAASATESVAAAATQAAAAVEVATVAEAAAAADSVSAIATRLAGVTEAAAAADAVTGTLAPKLVSIAEAAAAVDASVAHVQAAADSLNAAGAGEALTATVVGVAAAAEAAVAAAAAVAGVSSAVAIAETAFAIAVQDGVIIPFVAQQSLIQQVTGSGIYYRSGRLPDIRPPAPRPRLFQPQVYGGLRIGAAPIVEFRLGIFPRTYLPVISGGLELCGSPPIDYIRPHRAIVGVGGSPLVKYFQSMQVSRPSRLRVKSRTSETY